MTKDLDRRIREIVALTRSMERNDWELADRLWALDQVDYEQALLRLIGETGWTRNVLSRHRETARCWPKAERMAELSYAMHEKFKYRKEELRRTYRTKTVGQTTRRRTQRYTMTALVRAVGSIIALCDDKALTDRQRVMRIRQVIEIFRGTTGSRAA